MRRLLSLSSLLAGIALATLIGCSGEKKDDAPKVDDSTTEKKPSKKTAKKALAFGAGVLKGKVTLDGPTPNFDAENAELLKQITAIGADKDHCLADVPADQKTQQKWKIGEGNGVANVVVFLTPAEGTTFEINDKHPGVEAVKDKDVILDQPHCAFVPHGLVLFPSYNDGKSIKKTGQKLLVKNSAKIPHNTKYGDGGGDNPGGNQNIPPGKSVTVSDLVPSRTVVSVNCDIHRWMNGFIWVRDNPYFAITDKDGNYEIKNVPEGDVNVVAWHEDGNKFLNSGGTSKGEKIHLEGKETKKDFKAKVPAK